jgi:hypothetical protein
VELLEARLTPGKITEPWAMAGPGLGSVLVGGGPATGSVNNDNVGPGLHEKDNFVSMDVRFNFLGLIDVQFLVENTDGVSEYKFEVVAQNNTPVDFRSFEFKLGFGIWSFEHDDFILSGDADNLDFDWPNKDPVRWTPFFGPLDAL